MTIERTSIFAFLDENLGAGNSSIFEDYDSRDALLERARECVEEEPSLTQGCGVGPLMADITAWVAEFEAGRRTEWVTDRQKQDIQFSPTAHGYQSFLSEAEFLSLYPLPAEGKYRPQPFHAPERYPVFAKEICLLNNPSGDDHLIFSYFYHDEVQFVG